MFPLRAARRVESTPIITYLLVGINVLVFLWQTRLNNTELYQLYMSAGFVPCRTIASPLAPDSLLSAVTSMFLHGGWVHLLGNMGFLLAFGPAVEDYLGKRLYLGFYLLGGFGASAMHLLFNLGVCIPAIGASGAISAVMGGFLLLYPATRISTLILLFRIPVGVRDIPALYLLGGFFVLDLVNGLGALGANNINTGGVAFWAHVGGFLAGVVLSFFVMTFKPAPPVDPLASVLGEE
jgi:membrane associated rhomboid family serine protease